MREFDWDKITKAAFHDKKADGEIVTVTTVPDVGCFELKTMKCSEAIEMEKNVLRGDMREKYIWNKRGSYHCR